MTPHLPAMQEASKKPSLHQPWQRSTTEILATVGNIPLSKQEMQSAAEVISEGLGLRLGQIFRTAEQTDNELIAASVNREATRIKEGPIIDPENALITDVFPQCTRATTINELRGCIKDQYTLGTTGPNETFGHAVDTAAAQAAEFIAENIDRADQLEF